VAAAQLAHIEAVSAEPVPHFPMANGQCKIPAAWLIEKAGFTKGYERGRVGISSKHTLAIINHSSATANELLKFVALIQKQVQERFGIALVPEPVYIGLENQTPIPLATVQPVPEAPPPKVEPLTLQTIPLKPGRRFRKPEHNPLKTARKKWFE
jgi:hypothetical protein